MNIEHIKQLIDQDIYPSFYFNETNQDIEYMNVALLQLLIDPSYLLLKIKTHELNFKQGMQIDILGERYTCHRFKISTPVTKGMIISLRTMFPMTLEIFRDAYFLNAAEPSIIVDQKGMIFDSNLAFEESFGYINRVIKSLSIKDLIDKSKFTDEQSSIVQQIVEGFNFKNELIHIFDYRKVTIPTRMSTSKIYNHETYIGSVVSFRDIRDKINLEIQKLMFEKLLLHMTDGAIVVNKDYQIVYANDAYLTTTGFTLDNLVDQKIKIFNPVKHSKNLVKTVETHMQQKEEWHGEAWYPMIQDTYVMLWTSMYPIYYEKTDEVYYILVLKNHQQQELDPIKLSELVHKDNLTSLYNRYYFVSKVEKSLTQYPKHKQFLAFIDMDSFKQINDTHGHSYGDNILKQTALLFKQIFKGHMVARYGGDEFVVQFKLDTRKKDIKNYLKIFMDELDLFSKTLDKSIELSASIGFSEYPKDGKHVSDLIEKADERMYQYKKR